VVLQVFGRGDIVGELSVLDSEPHAATVVALEPVYTATLGRSEVMDLLRGIPSLAESLLRTLVGVIRRNGDQLADLVTLDLAGRLAKKLLELGEAHGQRAENELVIEVQLTQEELAGMVGGTRARVNKLLGEYEALGAIARRRRRITIVDPGILRQRAMA
jgi:CRP/FNR family transcriptional regulator/CRP/FNR family cyclic AMP-dependent transcriptional regulator